MFVLGNPFQSGLNLRERPEPTQLKYLSYASFLGKLLVFPANVRLDWKVMRVTNALAYLASLTVMKEKSFITLTPGKYFFLRHWNRVEMS